MNKVSTLVSYTGGIDVLVNGKGKTIECGERNIKTPGRKVVDEARAKAEKELEFIEKNNINVHFYLDDQYPKRLKQCIDAPVVLYGKGNYELNLPRTLSIVGTRNATDYGTEFCEKLLNFLKPYEVLIVSGMAYGIDICAHKAAVNNNLPTVGVLAHGLDRLYPNLHQKIANKMVDNGGGLLTEYPSETIPDKERFPARNRIVAGMSDATLVIESGAKGGSLITADLAFSYNRDVMALPGDVGRTYSKGCNKIIQQQKAAMIIEPEDLVKYMSWDIELEKSKEVQRSLFVELTPEQTIITDIIASEKEISIDELMIKSETPMSQLATILLTLEMEGVIIQKPGKRFQLLK